jgi:GGDEF domain-containing protein
VRKKILFVSEAKLFYKIFDAVLAEKYDSTHAFGAIETVKTLIRALGTAGGGYDLLIVSERIENGSCFDLISKVRKEDKRIRDMPAIILAENITTASIMSANRLSVDEALKLPIDPEVFAETVDAVLQHHAKPYQRPDPVTGLPIMRFAEEEIVEMLKGGSKGALFLIDLDHYSFVGTKVSDEALIKTRDVLHNMLPGTTLNGSEAVLAVLAGGGFMIFAPEMRDKKAVEDYAAAIIRGIKAAVDNEQMYVSVGLAVTDRHGTDYEELHKICDMGLSRARTSGKNKAFFYQW